MCIEAVTTTSAEESLVSVSQIDDEGGMVVFADGKVHDAAPIKITHVDDLLMLGEDTKTINNSILLLLTRLKSTRSMYICIFLY